MAIGGKKKVASEMKLSQSTTNEGTSVDGDKRNEGQNEDEDDGVKHTNETCL